MSSKLNKMKTEMSKRMDQDHTNMTAHRDYDFDRRSTDMRRLGHALDHFDHAVTQGMIAMKEIASAFEAVGQAFTELTLGTVNTYSPDRQEPAPFPTENEDLSAYNTAANNISGNDGSGVLTPEGSQQRMRNSHSDPNESGVMEPGRAASVASTKLTEETNGQVRRLAQMFAEETRRINEGQPFQTYNAGMHRDVVTRLRPVSEHLKSVEEYRLKRIEALERYNKYKAEVEKVEKQYAKKGKPFCDSKSHKKFAEKRDAAWAEYVKRRDKFNETFALLMEVNDHAAAQIIHRYLALNDEYLRQLVASIGRILPAMAEAYPLNQEYTTAQNSMILEAVANARTPFAKHYKQNEDSEHDEEGHEEGEEHDEDNGAHSTSGDLEEPTTDDHNNSGSADPHGPLMGDAAQAHEPPHADDDEDEDGRIRGAGNTSEEPGYTLTQKHRLTQGTDSADGKDKVPLPGAAVEY